MKRGKTEVETCHLNGWGVGTVVRGKEMWSEDKGVWTTLRITALGEVAVFARIIKREYIGQPERPDFERLSPETTVTFAHREWTEVTSTESPGS